MRMRLSELSVGTHAVIQSFEDDFAKLKLMEMGCLPGEPVILNAIAPLGDPLVLIVAGYKLSIRKTEAAGIWVEV